jgi:chitinase
MKLSGSSGHLLSTPNRPEFFMSHFYRDGQRAALLLFIFVCSAPLGCAAGPKPGSAADESVSENAQGQSVPGDTQDTNHGSEANPETDAVTDTGGGDDSGTDSDVETEPDPDDTTDADSDSDPDDTTDTDSDPDPDDTTDTDSDPDPDDTTDADSDPDPDDTTDINPENENSEGNGCSAGTQDLGAVSIHLTSTSVWETGQSVDVVLTNTSSTPLPGLQLAATNPESILSLWGLDGSPSLYTLPSWLQALAPGETYTFGLTASVGALPCFILLGDGPDTQDPDPDNTDLDSDSDMTDTDDNSTPLVDKKIVAYFVEWGVYERDYHVADIPADKLTHINYAFANVSESGECILYDSYAATDKFYPGDSWDGGAMRGSFHQLNLLKQSHPHLKTLISVGGWTLSSKFPQVASTADGRERFAQSCVEFMQTYGFDGIDIDWEYPVSGGLTDGTPADRENFTLLLQTIREALEDAGDGYLLTIAAPAGPSIYANIELDLIHPYLDFINVMTYDFHGGWESQTGHNAPMHPAAGDPFAQAQTYNIHTAIQAYLSAGIPREKVVMGLPFYGRGWQGVGSDDAGRFQSATDPASNGTWEAGVFDYKDLKNNFLGQGYERYWDESAQVPWLYNPATGIWISYDDPESIEIKSNYIIAENLGGAMYWELSSDTQDAELLTRVYETLSD